jgi:predicted nucleic acid-binding protein
MKKSIYLETTIISYFTARPPRDIILAARQEITRQWWDRRRFEYELFISPIVLKEASEGDPAAASNRLKLLNALPVLDMNQEVVNLAAALIEEKFLPPKAADDALHLAFAAVHEIDFLLTWNCRHLANAELIASLPAYFIVHDIHLPTVCTPDELYGE